jgi:tetratricopeptide (TPR) repeat protein
MPPREPAIKPALSRRWGIFMADGLIVLTVLAVYYNSFSGAFILDDHFIANSPSIRHFGSALFPPASSTASGRPVINLTFAFNYALGGIKVWSYHAFNLLVHMLAGLTLFGLVRRTLTRPALSQRFGADAVPLALAVAVIWAVHPLQTEAVAYISQRAESLMGLFYLLTLYCFVRSVESEKFCESPSNHSAGSGQASLGPSNPKDTAGYKRRPKTRVTWQIFSILACLLGAMSKEVIVTAPVMVLLYDRTFFAGSLREAWRLRWRYYLGLACTWLQLACLTNNLGLRGIGFEQPMTWWSYALISCRSVVLYLKLAIWPHPLVFDYGMPVVHHVREIIPCALVLALFLSAILIALRYRPVIGFAGTWFFMILVPTSSVIPISGQPMAEHRVYLSLTAVVVLGVLGLYRLIGRRSLAVCAATAAGLGWLTAQRNQDYRSELTIWSDTVAKCPDNERAHNNHGACLVNVPGQLPVAIAEFQAALRIKPDYKDAHYNLGLLFSQIPGRLPDAIAEFQAALRIRPDDLNAHNRLGLALIQQGNLDGALAQFKETVQIAPEDAQVHNNLGNALAKSGRLVEAIDQYELALRLTPDFTAAHNNLELVRHAVTQQANDRFKAGLPRFVGPLVWVIF